MIPIATSWRVALFLAGAAIVFRGGIEMKGEGAAKNFSSAFVFLSVSTAIGSFLILTACLGHLPW